MPYKVTSLLLMALLLHGSMVAQDQSQPPDQTAARMQQVLHKAIEKNKAVKVTLRRPIDHQRTFEGVVGNISDKGFDISNQKTQTTQSFTYEEVQQVQQKGMSKGRKVLIIGLVAVGGLVAMGFAVACNAEGGSHC